MWQALYEELGPRGFVPITVALDRNADEPRPFVDKAKPSHPSLLDTEHRVAELFNIVNVPTLIWIDERGVIVRPQDNQFGTDTVYNFVTAGTAHDILQFDIGQVPSAAKLLAGGHQMGTDTILTIDAQNSVTLKNTLLANLTLADIFISTKVV